MVERFARGTRQPLRSPRSLRLIFRTASSSFVSFVIFVVSNRMTAAEDRGPWTALRIPEPPGNPPNPIERTAYVHAAGYRIRLAVAIEIADGQRQ